MTGAPPNGDAAPPIIDTSTVEVSWTWALPSFEHDLTATERDRHRRLRRQADKDMFATGRALLRVVAGAWMSVPCRQVVVHTACARCGATDHGAPTIEPIDGARPAPHVSLTHAGGLVMVAATGAGPLGVDCEPLDTTLVAGFDDVVLAPREHAALAAAHAALAGDLREARLRTWVRKEAVLKATGQGLATDPRDVVLGLWSGPPHVVSAPGDVAPAGWWLADVDPVPGFLGAVASAAPLFGARELDVRQVDLRRCDVTGAPAVHDA